MSLDRSESRSEPKALRKLARQNKYDVKAVLWCPHQSQQDLLASTVSKSKLMTVAGEDHLIYILPVWEEERWRGGDGGREEGRKRGREGGRKEGGGG